MHVYAWFPKWLTLSHSYLPWSLHSWETSKANVTKRKFYTEFLNVTVSPSCNGAKFSWLGAKFWDLYVQTVKFMICFIFLIFLSIFTDLTKTLRFFLPIFLRKIFTSGSVTAPKNLLLECLILYNLNVCHKLSQIFNIFLL